MPWAGWGTWVRVASALCCWFHVSGWTPHPPPPATMACPSGAVSRMVAFETSWHTTCAQEAAVDGVYAPPVPSSTVGDAPQLPAPTWLPNRASLASVRPPFGSWPARLSSGFLSHLCLSRSERMPGAAATSVSPAASPLSHLPTCPPRGTEGCPCVPRRSPAPEQLSRTPRTVTSPRLRERSVLNQRAPVLPPGLSDTCSAGVRASR